MIKKIDWLKTHECHQASCPSRGFSYVIYELHAVRDHCSFDDSYAKYSKKLIKYQIIELKNNEHVKGVNKIQSLKTFLSNINFNFF